MPAGVSRADGARIVLSQNSAQYMRTPERESEYTAFKVYGFSVMLCRHFVSKEDNFYDFVLFPSLDDKAAPKFHGVKHFWHDKRGTKWIVIQEGHRDFLLNPFCMNSVCP